MRIGWIKLTDFEGAAKVDMTLGNVTVLRGHNGAGKTSTANAIVFALLGEVLRGGNLGDVIRFGKKTASVALGINGRAIERTQSEKAGVRKIDGVVMSANAFADEVKVQIGDPRAIRSVLASGAILSMGAADLQKFLVELSGGKLDATTIAAAFDDAVRTAATKHSIPLPTGLGDAWKTARAKSEAMRLARHQDLDKAKAAVKVAPPAGEEERKVANIEKAIATLQTTRDTTAKLEAASSADAHARRDEKLKAVKARIADLEQKLAAATKAIPPKPAPRDGDLAAEIRETREIAARLEAQVADLDRQIAAASSVVPVKDGDAALAATAEAAKAKAILSTQAVAHATTAAEQARIAQLTAERNAKNLPSAGECEHACEHCTVRNAGQILQAAKDDADRLKGVWITAKATLSQAQIEDALAAKADVEAAAAKARIDASALRVALTAKREALHPETVRASEARLLEESEAQRKYAEAVAAEEDVSAELVKAHDELTKVEAYKFPDAPATKVADLDARISREKAAVVAARARDEAAVLVAAQELAHERWKEHDLVCKALGPDGVIKGLVAGVVEPFLAAANEALALLAPEWTLEIDSDEFGFLLRQPGGVVRASQLSRGSKWRLRGVLQFAVAKLSKVPFLVFDESEDLDAQGRDGLGELIEACIGAGIQVLVLTHTGGDWVADEDFTLYDFENGVARPA